MKMLKNAAVAEWLAVAAVLGVRTHCLTLDDGEEACVSEPTPFPGIEGALVQLISIRNGGPYRIDLHHSDGWISRVGYALSPSQFLREFIGSLGHDLGKMVLEVRGWEGDDTEQFRAAVYVQARHISGRVGIVRLGVPTRTFYPAPQAICDLAEIRLRQALEAYRILVVAVDLPTPSPYRQLRNHADRAALITH